MKKPAVCQICGKSKPASELVPAVVVRTAIAEEIAKDYPQWSPEGFICRDDLGRFRNRHIQALIEAEKGELSDLEKEVVSSLREHDILARNIEIGYERSLTFGERLSDRIAAFGGSWRFLIIFGCVIVVWMAANTAAILRRPFDPYPYILLNLVLSCLAAVQAPVIMMSQNRQEAKDRLRSEHDYQVNLKAEVEIRQLHDKVDHMLSRQWERLVEIQQVQLELMNELMALRTKGDRR